MLPGTYYALCHPCCDGVNSDLPPTVVAANLTALVADCPIAAAITQPTIAATIHEPAAIASLDACPIQATIQFERLDAPITDSDLRGTIDA